MAVSKNIEYDNFCNIMDTAGWKYKIWESPCLIIRDFLDIEDCGLLVYTIEGHNSVFIKNIEDNRVVATVSGHNCTPSIFFIHESYTLLTGDSGTIRMWRLY